MDVVPDAPTLYELGYPFGIIMDEYAIVGPKGIPAAVVKMLEEAFLKSVETPRYRTFAENLHMYVPAPLHGQKYKEHFEKVYAKYGEIFRKVKLAK